jgi:replicative DNA helicase
MSNFQSPQENSTTEIQSQPNSREAEEAVLGSVLINPESYFEISEILKTEDFYIIRNQWIWAAFVRLFEKRVPIDILTW